MKSISIIGAGRLGTSLGLALKRAGYTLQAIACRSLTSVRESGEILGLSRMMVDPVEAAGLGDIIFLCLPDQGLPGIIKQLGCSDLNWPGKVVYHTSGLFSSRLLSSLKRRGAKVASFHPIQSFATKGIPPSRWRGVFISLEGDIEAVSLAEEIVWKIGATPLFIRGGNKSLYHAACSLASNHFVALFATSVELLVNTGLTEDEAIKALRPLVAGTAKNLKSSDPASALTGPIARSDLLTIRRHLAALHHFPSIERIYRELGLQAVNLAARKNLKPSRVRALRRLLRGK